MLLYSMQITHAQSKLLEAVRDLNYGEIYSVDDEPSEVSVMEELSPEEKKLLDTLKEEKHIDIIVVHNGIAVYAEIDKKLNSFRCRKRIKLS